MLFLMASQTYDAFQSVFNFTVSSKSPLVQNCSDDNKSGEPIRGAK